MEPLVIVADTPHDTVEIGAALAPLLRARDAVLLTGELGAGKTTLVRGVASGLEVTEPVASPTFTLIREYRGRLPVAHVDVYRLERIQDVVDLALDEVADGEAVYLVEWGDAIEELLPADRLLIELVPAGACSDAASDTRGSAPTDPDAEPRRLTFTAEGPGWAERWRDLEAVLAPWRAQP
jgi:tRNA threonylcarbamoyladenosine biosynthesis protein TsaE